MAAAKCFLTTTFVCALLLQVLAYFHFRSLAPSLPPLSPLSPLPPLSPVNKSSQHPPLSPCIPHPRQDPRGRRALSHTHILVAILSPLSPLFPLSPLSTPGKIRVGDVLHDIGEAPTAKLYSLDTPQAVRLLLGPPGSPVTLWLQVCWRERREGGTGCGASSKSNNYERVCVCLCVCVCMYALCV